MSSKIEVPLTDRLEDIAQDLTFMKDRNTIREAIALLAAPVVELQPAMIWSDYERISDIKSVDEALRAFSEDATGDNAVCVVRTIVESVTPPELQATIAQLQAELEHTGHDHDLLRNENAQLKSEIERLKGGQGEPVAWEIRYKDGDDHQGFVQTEERASYYRGMAYHVIPLFTSQPAPVSSELVQLLERAKVYARGPFLDEINACLDKQPAPVAEPWNGEGLPPVGAVCEYLFQPGHVLGEEVGTYFVRDREWVKAEVLLHHEYDGKKFAVIHAPAHGFRGCSDTTGEMFRPIACLDKELNQ